MRKHHVPFGWPRRDPRHSRFPLPNAVWEYQLKPIAFVILSYLCCHSSHGGTRVLTPEVIAKGIHKTEDTVRKYLSAESGKFFTLPTEIFLLNLPPAAFMVYAYLLLIEDRRTHTCHPSYNTIAATTGMSKNTVIKAINVLLEKHLVTLEHSQYLDQSGMKWNGNNLYTILPTQSAVDAFHQRQLCHLELEAQQRKLLPAEPSSHEPSRRLPSPPQPRPKWAAPCSAFLGPL